MFSKLIPSNSKQIYQKGMKEMKIMKELIALIDMKITKEMKSWVEMKEMKGLITLMDMKEMKEMKTCIEMKFMKGMIGHH